MNNLSIVELIKLALTLLAVIISIISLIKVNRNSKRHIRTSKIEEILDCIQNVRISYRDLFTIYANWYLIHMDKTTNDFDVENLKIQLGENINQYLSKHDQSKIQNNLSRLRTLSYAYISNKKLKLKLISLVGLIAEMNSLNPKIQNDLQEKKLPKYPTPDKLFSYLEIIDGEILKEMKLSVYEAKMNDVLKYQSIFKNDLKI